MRFVLALSVMSATLGSGCMAKSPTEDTREHMVADMTSVLKAWDKDEDGKLSRAEVAVMLDESFQMLAKDAPDGKLAADLERQRHGFLGFYASQDTNHDSYLTLDELLKGPLASFDCMDENHDGKVPQEEVFSGMERCPSVNLGDYAPKP